MELFKIIANDGKEGTLKIGEVAGNHYGNVKSIEVLELKVGNDIKAKNKIAYIAYNAFEKTMENIKYLKFANDGPILEITNPNLLKYLFEA